MLYASLAITFSYIIIVYLMVIHKSWMDIDNNNNIYLKSNIQCI